MIQWLISEQTAGDLGRARRPRPGSFVTRVPLRTASIVTNAAIEETKPLFVFSLNVKTLGN